MSKGFRHECRHGTHECVRHIGANVFLKSTSRRRAQLLDADQEFDFAARNAYGCGYVSDIFVASQQSHRLHALAHIQAGSRGWWDECGLQCRGYVIQFTHEFLHLLAVRGGVLVHFALHADEQCERGD